MSDCRIWFGSLAAYNNGILSGEWVELPATEEQLRKIFNKYTNNGQNDFFIADWELPFEISEYQDIFTLNAVIEQYSDLDASEQDAFEYLVTQENMNFNDAFDRIDEVTFHACRTFKDLAVHYVDEGYFGEIPERLSGYIDYDAIGRDLKLDGLFTAWNGQIVEYPN